jgi:SAM-dependent methyltransferase
MNKELIKINLGAGSEPNDPNLGWVNVDHLDLPGIQVVHNLLNLPYPFDDGSASYIKAIDLLEHLPNYTPDGRPTVIAFVEECHRILNYGGILNIQVPHWASPNMWIDPTHVRGFDLKSFDYFDPDKDFGKWYGYYSNKKFRVRAELSIMENQPDTENNGKPSNLTFSMVKL